MSHNNKNIDQLFLNKSFHELTKEEKLEISEFVKTESEFNDTKMMLISVEKELNSIKDIEPKEATKTHLLNEFNKIRPVKSSRPMGLGIFFPSDKPFHRKLGIQIIAVAAAIVLIFTLLDPSKGKLTQESETAIIEEKEHTSEELIIKEIESNVEAKPIKEKDLIDEVDHSPASTIENDKIADNKTVAAEKALPPPPPISIIADVYDSEELNTLKTKKENNQSEIAKVFEELAEDGLAVIDNSDKEDIDLDDAVVINEIGNNVPDSGSASKDFSDVSVSPSVNVDESFATANSSTEVEKSRASSTPQIESTSIVRSSKTLAENKELIKHFYTAM